MPGKMTTEDKIRAAIARHPDWDDGHIATHAVRMVRIADVAAVRAGQPALPRAEGPAREAVGFVSLDRVIAKLDVAAAIRREIAALPLDQLILETELRRKAAGTDANRFRRAVENNEDEFRAVRIKLKLDDSEPKWYWGQAATIARALEIRDK